MTIITIKELSEFLKVAPKTLYQWAEQKQIPCLKLNGTLRFDMDEIRIWLDSCKRSTALGYNPLSRLEARKGGKKS
ncbi:MAG TPA: hypothetical protein DCP92_06205 [Nitrospiraceae bacterium]|jgi:excisionase family DNA binding protein|nr:hypothetical protein [Nitrospiraceae bacterium]